MNKIIQPKSWYTTFWHLSKGHFALAPWKGLRHGHEASAIPSSSFKNVGEIHGERHLVSRSAWQMHQCFLYMNYIHHYRINDQPFELYDGFFWKKHQNHVPYILSMWVTVFLTNTQAWKNGDSRGLVYTTPEHVGIDWLSCYLQHAAFYILFLCQRCIFQL